MTHQNIPSRRKRKLLHVFEIFMDPECKAIKELLSLPNDNTGTAKLAFLIHQQFALRIIFYEPTLFMKSLEKVSLKDLILSDDFTLEDAVRFFDLWKEMMGFTLKWCKDAVIDALAIVRHGTAANVGPVRKLPCILLEIP
jgi:hypothetical protein